MTQEYEAHDMMLALTSWYCLHDTKSISSFADRGVGGFLTSEGSYLAWQVSSSVERKKNIYILGVGDRGSFLGHFLKSLAPLFFSMGNGPIKLNLKFFWKIWISKKLPHEKPTASLEIHILIEFVKQNKSYSI